MLEEIRVVVGEVVEAQYQISVVVVRVVLNTIELVRHTRPGVVIITAMAIFVMLMR
jgi:hypothetical protein